MSNDGGVTPMRQARYKITSKRKLSSKESEAFHNFLLEDDQGQLAPDMTGREQILFSASRGIYQAEKSPVPHISRSRSVRENPNSCGQPSGREPDGPSRSTLEQEAVDDIRKSEKPDFSIPLDEFQKRWFPEVVKRYSLETLQKTDKHDSNVNTSDIQNFGSCKPIENDIQSNMADLFTSDLLNLDTNGSIQYKQRAQSEPAKPRRAYNLTEDNPFDVIFGEASKCLRSPRATSESRTREPIMSCQFTHLNTARPHPDTDRPLPDIARPQPDTARAQPDTARAQPDTARAQPEGSHVAPEPRQQQQGYKRGTAGSSKIDLTQKRKEKLKKAKTRENKLPAIPTSEVPAQAESSNKPEGDQSGSSSPCVLYIEKPCFRFGDYTETTKSKEPSPKSQKNTSSSNPEKKIKKRKENISNKRKTSQKQPPHIAEVEVICSTRPCRDPGDGDQSPGSDQSPGRVQSPGSDQSPSRVQSQFEAGQGKTESKPPPRKERSCEIKYFHPCTKRRSLGRKTCKGNFFVSFAEAFGSQLTNIASRNQKFAGFPGMHGLYTPDSLFYPAEEEEPCEEDEDEEGGRDIIEESMSSRTETKSVGKTPVSSERGSMEIMSKKSSKVSKTGSPSRPEGRKQSLPETEITKSERRLSETVSEREEAIMNLIMAAKDDDQVVSESPQSTPGELTEQSKASVEKSLRSSAAGSKWTSVTDRISEISRAAVPETERPSPAEESEASSTSTEESRSRFSSERSRAESRASHKESSQRLELSKQVTPESKLSLSRRSGAGSGRSMTTPSRTEEPESEGMLEPHETDVAATLSLIVSEQSGTPDKILSVASTVRSRAAEQRASERAMLPEEEAESNVVSELVPTTPSSQRQPTIEVSQVTVISGRETFQESKISVISSKSPATLQEEKIPLCDTAGVSEGRPSPAMSAAERTHSASMLEGETVQESKISLPSSARSTSKSERAIMSTAVSDRARSADVSEKLVLPRSELLVQSPASQDKSKRSSMASARTTPESKKSLAFSDVLQEERELVYPDASDESLSLSETGQQLKRKQSIFVESRLSTAIGSSPTTAIGSRLSTAIGSSPSTAVGSKPSTAIGSSPSTTVGSKPSTAVESRPPTAVESRTPTVVSERTYSTALSKDKEYVAVSEHKIISERRRTETPKTTRTPEGRLSEVVSGRMQSLDSAPPVPRKETVLLDHGESKSERPSIPASRSSIASILRTQITEMLPAERPSRSESEKLSVPTTRTSAPSDVRTESSEMLPAERESIAATASLKTPVPESRISISSTIRIEKPVITESESIAASERSSLPASRISMPSALSTHPPEMLAIERAASEMPSVPGTAVSAVSSARTHWSEMGPYDRESEIMPERPSVPPPRISTASTVQVQSSVFVETESKVVSRQPSVPASRISMASTVKTHETEMLPAELESIPTPSETSVPPSRISMMSAVRTHLSEGATAAASERSTIPPSRISLASSVRTPTLELPSAERESLAAGSEKSTPASVISKLSCVGVGPAAAAPDDKGPEPVSERSSAHDERISAASTRRTSESEARLLSGTPQGEPSSEERKSVSSQKQLSYHRRSLTESRPSLERSQMMETTQSKTVSEGDILPEGTQSFKTSEDRHSLDVSEEEGGQSEFVIMTEGKRASLERSYSLSASERRSVPESRRSEKRMSKTDSGKSLTIPESKRSVSERCEREDAWKEYKPASRKESREMDLYTRPALERAAVRRMDKDESRKPGPEEYKDRRLTGDSAHELEISMKCDQPPYRKRTLQNCIQVCASVRSPCNRFVLNVLNCKQAEAYQEYSESKDYEPTWTITKERPRLLEIAPSSRQPRVHEREAKRFSPSAVRSPDTSGARVRSPCESILRGRYPEVCRSPVSGQRLDQQSPCDWLLRGQRNPGYEQNVFESSLGSRYSESRSARSQQWRDKANVVGYDDDGDDRPRQTPWKNDGQIYGDFEADTLQRKPSKCSEKQGTCDSFVEDDDDWGRSMAREPVEDTSEYDTSHEKFERRLSQASQESVSPEKRVSPDRSSPRSKSRRGEAVSSASGHDRGTERYGKVRGDYRVSVTSSRLSTTSPSECSSLQVTVTSCMDDRQKGMKKYSRSSQERTDDHDRTDVQSLSESPHGSYRRMSPGFSTQSRRSTRDGDRDHDTYTNMGKSSARWSGRGGESSYDDAEGRLASRYEDSALYEDEQGSSRHDSKSTRFSDRTPARSQADHLQERRYDSRQRAGSTIRSFQSGERGTRCPCMDEQDKSEITSPRLMREIRAARRASKDYDENQPARQSQLPKYQTSSRGQAPQSLSRSLSDQKRLQDGRQIMPRPSSKSKGPAPYVVAKSTSSRSSHAVTSKENLVKVDIWRGSRDQESDMTSREGKDSFRARNTGDLNKEISSQPELQPSESYTSEVSTSDHSYIEENSENTLSASPGDLDNEYDEEVSNQKVKTGTKCVELSEIKKLRGRITFRCCDKNGENKKSSKCKSATVSIQRGNLKMIASPQGTKIMKCDKKCEESESSSESRSYRTPMETDKRSRQNICMDNFLSDSCMDRYEPKVGSSSKKQRWFADCCQDFSCGGRGMFSPTFDYVSRGYCRQRSRSTRQPSRLQMSSPSKKYYKHRGDVYGARDERMSRHFVKTDRTSHSNSASRRYRSDRCAGVVDLFDQIITPEKPPDLQNRHETHSSPVEFPDYCLPVTDVSASYSKSMMLSPVPASTSMPLSSNNMCNNDARVSLEAATYSRKTESGGQAKTHACSDSTTPSCQDLTRLRDFYLPYQDDEHLHGYSNYRLPTRKAGHLLFSEANLNCSLDVSSQKDIIFFPSKLQDLERNVNTNITKSTLKGLPEFIVKDSDYSDDQSNLDDVTLWQRNTSFSCSAERNQNSSSGNGDSSYPVHGYSWDMIDNLKLQDNDVTSSTPSSGSSSMRQSSGRPSNSSIPGLQVQDLSDVVKSFSSLALSDSSCHNLEKVDQNSLRAAQYAMTLSLKQAGINVCQRFSENLDKLIGSCSSSSTTSCQGNDAGHVLNARMYGSNLENDVGLKINQRHSNSGRSNTTYYSVPQNNFVCTCEAQHMGQGYSLPAGDCSGETCFPGVQLRSSRTERYLMQRSGGEFKADRANKMMEEKPESMKFAYKLNDDDDDDDMKLSSMSEAVASANAGVRNGVRDKKKRNKMALRRRKLTLDEENGLRVAVSSRLNIIPDFRLIPLYLSRSTDSLEKQFKDKTNYSHEERAGERSSTFWRWHMSTTNSADISDDGRHPHDGQGRQKMKVFIISSRKYPASQKDGLQTSLPVASRLEGRDCKHVTRDKRDLCQQRCDVRKRNFALVSGKKYHVFTRDELIKAVGTCKSSHPDSRHELPARRSLEKRQTNKSKTRTGNLVSRDMNGFMDLAKGEPFANWQAQVYKPPVLSLLASSTDKTGEVCVPQIYQLNHCMADAGTPGDVSQTFQSRLEKDKSNIKPSKSVSSPLSTLGKQSSGALGADLIEKPHKRGRLRHGLQNIGRLNMKIENGGSKQTLPSKSDDIPLLFLLSQLTGNSPGRARSGRNESEHKTWAESQADEECRFGVAASHAARPDQASPGNSIYCTTKTTESGRKEKFPVSKEPVKVATKPYNYSISSSKSDGTNMTSTKQGSYISQDSNTDASYISGRPPTNHGASTCTKSPSLRLTARNTPQGVHCDEQTQAKRNLVPEEHMLDFLMTLIEDKLKVFFDKVLERWISPNHKKYSLLASDKRLGQENGSRLYNVQDCNERNSSSASAVQAQTTSSVSACTASDSESEQEGMLILARPTNSLRQRKNKTSESLRRWNGSVRDWGTTRFRSKPGHARHKCVFYVKRKRLVPTKRSRQNTHRLKKQKQSLSSSSCSSNSAGASDTISDEQDLANSKDSSDLVFSRSHYESEQRQSGKQDLRDRSLSPVIKRSTSSSPSRGRRGNGMLAGVSELVCPSLSSESGYHRKRWSSASGHRSLQLEGKSDPQAASPWQQQQQKRQHQKEEGRQHGVTIEISCGCSKGEACDVLSGISVLPDKRCSNASLKQARNLRDESPPARPREQGERSVQQGDRTRGLFEQTHVRCYQSPTADPRARKRSQGDVRRDKVLDSVQTWKQKRTDDTSLRATALRNRLIECFKKGPNRSMGHDCEKISLEVYEGFDPGTLTPIKEESQSQELSSSDKTKSELDILDSDYTSRVLELSDEANYRTLDMSSASKCKLTQDNTWSSSSANQSSSDSTHRVPAAEGRESYMNSISLCSFEEEHARHPQNYFSADNKPTDQKPQSFDSHSDFCSILQSKCPFKSSFLRSEMLCLANDSQRSSQFSKSKHAAELMRTYARARTAVGNSYFSSARAHSVSTSYRSRSHVDMRWRTEPSLELFSSLPVPYASSVYCMPAYDARTKAATGSRDRVSNTLSQTFRYNGRASDFSFGQCKNLPTRFSKTFNKSYPTPTNNIPGSEWKNLRQSRLYSAGFIDFRPSHNYLATRNWNESANNGNDGFPMATPNGQDQLEMPDFYLPGDHRLKVNDAGHSAAQHSSHVFTSLAELQNEILRSEIIVTTKLTPCQLLVSLEI